MAVSLLLDVAPDPVGIGIVLAVILFVIVSVVLLAAALVFFLWYRKRSKLKVESFTAVSVSPIQPSSPNQP